MPENTPDWAGPFAFVAPLVVGGVLGYLAGDQVCSNPGQPTEVCTRQFNGDLAGFIAALGFVCTGMFEFIYEDNVIGGIAAIVVGAFCLSGALALF
jgi:hypothetical protein